MMQMRVRATVTGLDRIIAKNNLAIKALDNSKDELEKALNTAVWRAKLTAPRKTGALVKGIHWKKVGKNKYEVVCDVPYASYLEYGTRYIPIGTVNRPRAYITASGKHATMPFLRPALWKTMKEYPHIMRRILFDIYKR